MLDHERNERVIEVADIAPHYRHKVIFQLFERLDPEQSLLLVADHDPKPLSLQLQSRHGERCRWEYLEEGPDVWRVRLRLAKCQTGRTCGRSGQRSADVRPQLA